MNAVHCPQTKRTPPSLITSSMKMFCSQDVLDAEDFDKCVFWVQARSRNQIVSRTSITVLVNNINDNQPQFVNSSYTGFVEESQNSNTNVLQANGKPLVVKATDLDAGQNGKIKFSFVESAASIYFTIGERSGEIKTNFVRINFFSQWNAFINVSLFLIYMIFVFLKLSRFPKQI